MSTARKAVPRATRDEVLREFNHACAICGTANPQIHHIDGDHSNNDPLDLLPLCPNCHLGDQHNPTRPLEPGRVLLFRRFKDPAILSPQFEPLYARLQFLNEPEVRTAETKTLESRAAELIDFVGALEMGDFYAKRLKKLIGRINHVHAWSPSTPDSEFERWAREEHAQYVKKLVGGREDANRLAVELLRYQPWQR